MTLVYAVIGLAVVLVAVIGIWNLKEIYRARKTKRNVKPED